MRNTATLPGRKMLRDLNGVVTRARMFQHKPDGDVNIFMMKVRAGTPPSPLVCLLVKGLVEFFKLE